MQSETPSPPSTTPTGLPPVTPPSGKFILQLFLVPGLIVTLVVGLLLAITWLFGSARTPEAFLKKLDDPNPEVRWRAASDLAQTLPRDNQLSTNADFALKLADRLQKAVQESLELEKACAEKVRSLKLDELEKQWRELKEGPAKAEAEQQLARVRAQAEGELRKVEPQRNYIQFLRAALSGFMAPVGVAILNELAEKEPEMETQALALRRRQAVWALANLGESCRRFDRLPELEQDLLLDQLKKLKESTSGEQKTWVSNALNYLEQRRAGKHLALGVDRTLTRTAEAQDPVLREATAFASSFWPGNAEENKRMEALLERLAHDPGTGEDHTEDFSGPDPSGTKEVLKKPGLIVRVNATLAQLRRGSDKVRVGMVEEMLDEKGLAEDIQIEEANGKPKPNEGKARLIVVWTLKALAEFYRLNPKADLPGIAARVKELTDSPHPEIKTAARQVFPKEGER